MKTLVAILIVLLSLLTPAYAEVITDFQSNALPPTQEESSTGTPRFQEKVFTTAIVASFTEVFMDGQYVNDKDTLEAEYNRAQKALTSALNQNLGNLGALTHAEQVSWYRACVKEHAKNRNYDPTKVVVDGAKAPVFIVEITDCTISHMDGDDGYDVNFGNVSVNTGHSEEQTVVEYKAIIRDAKTHNKLCDCKQRTLTFNGKSVGVNESTSVSIYGCTIGLSADRNRQKDNNLDIAHRTAGATLAADINRQLKGYPL